MPTLPQPPCVAELLGSSDFGRRRLFFDKLKNAANDAYRNAVDWVEGAVDTVVTTAESVVKDVAKKAKDVVKEVESAIESATNWLDDLRTDVEYVPLCPPFRAHAPPHTL